MENIASRINIRQRLTQIIVLVAFILAGLLFSQVAQAQSNHGHKIRLFKGKYNIAIHKNSDRSCYILHKKRTSMPKHPLIASSKRPKSNKALAETDEPARLNSSN